MNKEQIVKKYVSRRGDQLHINDFRQLEEMGEHFSAGFDTGVQHAEEWISVEADLPPFNTKVIAYFPDGDESGEQVGTGKRSYDKVISSFPNSTAYCFEATMWKPLPPKPTEQ